MVRPLYDFADSMTKTTFSRQPIWMGYKSHGNPRKDNWYWDGVDGSSEFDNWKSSQPNGYYGDKEDEDGYCATMNKYDNYKWIDTSCSIYRAYLCESTGMV